MKCRLSMSARRLRNRISASVALIVAVAISQPSFAADVVLPMLDLEPQYSPKLCWAAADVAAVSSFFPTNSCQSGATPGRISQAIDAAYGKLSITSLPVLQSRISSNASQVTTMLQTCATNIQICADFGTPILLGLNYQQNTNGTSLTWLQAKQQIDVGHPFLFVWNYPSNGPKSRPVGLHQLLAIGYNDDAGAQLLYIWDPWPVPASVPTADPGCQALDVHLTPAQLKNHQSPIDFSTYTDPESDMGIAAVHDSDQFNLALPEIPNPPTDVQVEGPPQPKPPTLQVKRALRPAPAGPSSDAKKRSGISLAAARRDSLPESERLAVLSRHLRGATGGAAGATTVGTPFPIVALGLDDLRRARTNPASLLSQVTSAVLFPIESNGTVVGSFLMLFRNGTWHRGGYSNTEITRLLVQVRLQYAQEHHLDTRDFYMVSVPGLVAFFAAYGSGSQAVLIPASSDASIGAVAGSPVPAAKELSVLARAVP